jgi:hypothetical protein
MMGQHVKRHWRMFRVERALPQRFLLPQTVPLLISSSIRGKRADEAHAGGCAFAYRSRARITAELPTVQPKTSEACWLRFRNVRSVSAVSEWVRMVIGSFVGCAIQRVINSLRVRTREREHATGELIP